MQSFCSSVFQLGLRANREPRLPVKFEIGKNLRYQRSHGSAIFPVSFELGDEAGFKENTAEMKSFLRYRFTDLHVELNRKVFRNSASLLFQLYATCPTDSIQGIRLVNPSLCSIVLYLVVSI